MALLVLKFGGSSVATTARIKNVSEIVSKLISEGNQVVVVTSAMQGATDHLIDLTRPFLTSSFNREYDAVISSGEQVAAGLLALSLNSIGVQAKSFSAWQIPIQSTSDHSNAEIINVNKDFILNQLNQGITPVVTGFQGISEWGDICTIGRGGSDATACAIANAIEADECLIYTDVDGVYTADPRIILNAKKIPQISFDDMVQLANWGAKVLQTKSTLIAKKYNVNLKVLSSFSSEQGTKVSSTTEYVSNSAVTGIAQSLNLFVLKLLDLSAVDIISHFVHAKLPDQVSSFLISKTFQSEVISILDNANVKFEIDNDIGVATVIGDFSKDDTTKSLISNLLTENGIKTKAFLTTPNSISVLMSFVQTEIAVNLLHKEFFE